MGLNLKTGNYKTENSKIGSYRNFGEFRKAWAKHLGLDLSEMDGFGGIKKWTNEPLQSFFNHSDCDGKLSVEDCKEILIQVEKDKKVLKGFKYEFGILIEFCEEAIKRNEPLEFV